MRAGRFDEDRRDSRAGSLAVGKASIGVRPSVMGRGQRKRVWRKQKNRVKAWAVDENRRD